MIKKIFTFLLSFEAKNVTRLSLNVRNQDLILNFVSKTINGIMLANEATHSPQAFRAYIRVITMVITNNYVLYSTLPSYLRHTYICIIISYNNNKSFESINGSIEQF
jgi:hypothetical protein